MLESITFNSAFLRVYLKEMSEEQKAWKGGDWEDPVSVFPEKHSGIFGELGGFPRGACTSLAPGRRLLPPRFHCSCSKWPVSITGSLHLILTCCPGFGLDPSGLSKLPEFLILRPSSSAVFQRVIRWACPPKVT